MSGVVHQPTLDRTYYATPAGGAPVIHAGTTSELHISDVVVPNGVTLQHEDEELVVQVTVPRGMDEGEEAEGEEATAEAESESSEESADK